MSARRLLEIACGSLGSALAAQSGGADRVELFADLAGGGTTPSHGTVAVARDRLRLPLFVLVRPRTGDFLYDEPEVDAMLADIRHCRALGCDGVVLGALTAEATIDLPVCRELVAAAGDMQVTFHRAFDAVRDPHAALEDVVTLGCARVLSSGAQASALEGASELARRIAQAKGRIRMMAGAGITSANIVEVAQRSGCVEFHASASRVRASRMVWRNGSLRGLDNDHPQSDVAEIAALRAALDRADAVAKDAFFTQPRPG